MAGLLQRFARQLFGISTQNQSKPTNNAVSRTVSRTAGSVRTTNESGTIVVDRTIKRERTQEEVAREDYLLNQIDEFREKAKKLQDLLLSKESKVEELQSIVEEKEVQTKELQKRADVITEEMNQQIDKLIQKVTDKMSEIEAAMNTDLADGRKLSEEQAAQMKEALEGLSAQLTTLKTDLSEKIHSENVKCYRNVADLSKILEDKIDKISVVEAKADSIHKCAVAVIVLTVINLLGLVAFALYELGIIQMMIG